MRTCGAVYSYIKQSAVCWLNLSHFCIEWLYMNQKIVLDNGDIDFGLGDLQSSLVLVEKLCPRCGRKAPFPEGGEPGLSAVAAVSKWSWYKEKLFGGEWHCKTCCRLNQFDDLAPAPRKQEIKVTVRVTEAQEPATTTERITVIDEKYCTFEIEYERFDTDMMMKFDAMADDDALLGIEGGRWLCKGGTVLESSASGVGKSVSRFQRALSNCVGIGAFGIAPVGNKRIRSLIIQAENDFGDESEMFQGIVNGLVKIHGGRLGLTAGDIMAAAKENIVVCRLSASGDVFAQALELLIKRYRPDIVYADPMFSFWGNALSDLGEFTQFTRNRITPILFRHRVALWLTHHFEKTGKGFFGPSDLKNWARACVDISRCEEDPDTFCFHYTKRGERSGVVNQKYFAKHSNEGIYWEETAEPIRVNAPVVRRLQASTINKEVEEKTKEADELKRAFKLVKPNDEIEVKDLLGRIKAEFACQQRKAEYIWQIMRAKGETFDFVQVAPGRYRVEEPKPF